MRILVVEDESPIRESLVRSLNKLGYTEISEASDGVEAISIAAAFHPEIILADIKMPKMDGLQFIGNIRKDSPETACVIISGYDTFEYAQKAITLGVSSYLLKPVKDSELETVLDTIAGNLSESKKILDNNIKTQMRTRRYLEHARRNFILELVQERLPGKSILDETLSELGIRLHNGLLMVVLIYIDNYEELCKNISNKELELFKFSIQNIACEIFSEENVLPYSFTIDHRLGFLLSLPWTEPADCERLNAAFHKIRENFTKFFRLTLTLSAGYPVANLSLAYKSFASANKAAMLRLVKGGNQVFKDPGEPSSQKNTVNITLETEQKLMICLKTCNKKEAVATITELYRPFYSSVLDRPEGLMKLNFQIIYTLYRIMDQMGLPLEQSIGSEIELYSQVNSLSTWDKVEEFFSTLVQSCLEIAQEHQTPWNKRIMAKAMEYILKNFHAEISVGMVAEHVNLSQSYFCKLFREEYKESFTDFLIKLRIKKSMEYLKQGIYTVSEISRIVGFNDEKYFHRAFKKATGITPGNYKKA